MKENNWTNKKSGVDNEAGYEIELFVAKDGGIYVNEVAQRIKRLVRVRGADILELELS